jgi:hypothetical protein
MTRYLLIVSAAVVGFATAARAGGPPPVYVVVDKVTVEPSAGDPERIKIAGSFVRQEKARNHEYGKPVEGYVYLGIGKGKEAETRAEWAKWRKAAGTGKVVAVGHCEDAGAMLAVKIRKPDEKATEPDAVYTPGHIDAIDRPDGGASDRHAPVKNLLAFVKERKEAKKTADQSSRK